MNEPPPPQALPWLGGKSQRHGLGRWVLSLLPEVERNQTYVEPFGGMASVLLARERCANEIINDLDGRVANFWRVLRDEADELERLLAATPYCRDTYCEACDVLNKPDVEPAVRRAWAFVVVTGQIVMAKPERPSHGRWRQPHPIRFVAPQWHSIVDRLTTTAMRERLKNVVVENTDGAVLIARFSHSPSAVIYADPPYQKGASLYEQKSCAEALMSAVADAEAKVAISGYPDDPFDELGWKRHEYETSTRHAHKGGTGMHRVECLWVNYNQNGGTQKLFAV